jgi:hypothetical protein
MICCLFLLYILYGMEFEGAKDRKSFPIFRYSLGLELLKVRLLVVPFFQKLFSRFICNEGCLELPYWAKIFNKMGKFSHFE